MMDTQAMSQRTFVPVMVMVLLFFLISPYAVWGEGPTRIILENTSPQKISLIVGKSIIIRSQEPIKRVSLGSADIADALVLTARQISLTGKTPGVTNLTLWGLDNKVSAILDLEISPEVSRIEETLGKILPEEKDIRVTATHDNITLSGTVSSLPKKEEVLKLVDPYFPKKIVDLLKVEPSNTDEVSRFEEILRKILPDERNIRVSVARENIAIAGTVSSKPKSDQVLSLAELYFPKKVVNLLEVEAPLDVTILNASRFKEMLHQIFPDEKDIKITPTYNDNITLSGSVSSTSCLSQVLALADSYFPKEKEKERVINLLEVGGVNQVMLEVRVAEMSRSLIRRLGFNFTYVSSSGKNLGLSLLNKLTSLPSGGGFPAQPLVVSDKISGILRFVSWDTSWTFFVDALKEEGLLKVLAEPTLITLSGKTADFLAGGEFPVPVPSSGSNSLSIEWKKFGVGLNFTPAVLSNKKISMQVAPEVSELDFSNGIQISGIVVPALTTRRVSTTIELADGQSFAIAGLLKDEVRELIDKFPILGDIPILGPLFRSSNFQKNETELIIIVTPHLVKPLDMAKQTLPTDQLIEPDDFEFYILGTLEGREKTKPSGPGSSAITPNKKVKLEGSFGHIIPK
jgi:pilus assembly protein CpaC